MNHENKTNFYQSILPRIIQIGRGHGYAIAVHGSLKRDLDLIAVPWVENPKKSEDLVEAIRFEFDLTIDHTYDDHPYISGNPEIKPHGRHAWSMYFDPKRYIDLSIVPFIE